MAASNIGSFAKFVCFDCATVETEFLPTAKAWKNFKEKLVSSDCCKSCSGQRFYFKDQFGNTIDISDGK